MTVLRASFPRAEVERRRPIDGAEVFVIAIPRGAVGWDPPCFSTGRRLSALRVPSFLLSACRDEATVAALIAGAVPRLRTSELVEI